MDLFDLCLPSAVIYQSRTPPEETLQRMAASLDMVNCSKNMKNLYHYAK